MDDMLNDSLSRACVENLSNQKHVSLACSVKVTLVLNSEHVVEGLIFFLFNFAREILNNVF